MKNCDQMPSIKSSFPPCALLFLSGILTFDGKKQRKGKKVPPETYNDEPAPNVDKNSGCQHKYLKVWLIIVINFNWKLSSNLKCRTSMCTLCGWRYFHHFHNFLTCLWCRRCWYTLGFMSQLSLLSQLQLIQHLDEERQHEALSNKHKATHRRERWRSVFILLVFFMRLVLPRWRLQIRLRQTSPKPAQEKTSCVCVKCECVAERFRDNKSSRCCGSLHVNKHHHLMKARRRKCFPQNENSNTLYIPLSRRMSAAANVPLNTAPPQQVLRQKELGSLSCKGLLFCCFAMRCKTHGGD